MFVALASLFTGRPVRHDVAMTGEISLPGVFVEAQKVLAAQRGIVTVLLPARNLKDLRDVPDGTGTHGVHRPRNGGRCNPWRAEHS
jgi:ATP-dependent Lon protease